MSSTWWRIAVCVAVASRAVPTYAQSAVTRHTQIVPALKRDTAFRVPAASRSRSTTGAVIGGAVGVAAGLILGHKANIGCLSADAHCNPVNKQRKAMAVTAVLLGAVGSGAGYLIGRFWPEHNAAAPPSSGQREHQ